MATFIGIICILIAISVFSYLFKELKAANQSKSRKQSKVGKQLADTNMNIGGCGCFFFLVGFLILFYVFVISKYG